MRVAILSDTHGNCLALDAVLADLKSHPVDTGVCLGDMIQGGPEPAQLVERLRALNWPIVMGNADDWMLTGKETGAEATSERQLRVREWSLAQLSDADKEFIAGFAPTVELELEGGKKLLAFHGSPHSYDDIILPSTPEEDFARLLGVFVPAIMCGGHTHMQQLRRLNDTFFFNPGSIGLAYNHNQPDETFRADLWADYAVLTSEGGRIALEFRKVPIDGDEVVRILFASGIPYVADRAKLFHWTGGE